MSKAEDQFLLRRMLVCGHCGSGLRSSSNGKTKHSKPIRYYVCPCHAPTRARKLDKPVCELPDVPSIAVEAEAWRIVSETLLNADVLAAGLEAARSTRGAAERVRRDQRAVIDAEIAKHRKTLDSLVDQLVKLESAALIEAVDRRAKELESTIANLTRQRDALIAGPSDGLTDAEAAAIQEFAATARIGLDEATPAERRQLFETLRLRGRVLADPEGLLLGAAQPLQDRVGGPHSAIAYCGGLAQARQCLARSTTIQDHARRTRHPQFRHHRDRSDSLRSRSECLVRGNRRR